MRILGNSNIDTVLAPKAANNTVEKPATIKQEKQPSEIKAPTKPEVTQLDNTEETKAKVQEVVNKMNEMLDVANNASKFMYHEGLDRYYVTVVDRKTDEIVKEIPPKKLLDAFYEMQKMLGMVVDEKI
jgi:flagellar protein FlaG